MQVFYTINLSGDGMLEKEEFIAAFGRQKPKKKKKPKLIDPLEAAERCSPSRPISAKSIKWKAEFG